MEDDLLNLTKQAHRLLGDALDLVVTSGGPLSEHHIVAVTGLLALSLARVEGALSCAVMLYGDNDTPDFGIARGDE